MYVKIQIIKGLLKSKLPRLLVLLQANMEYFILENMKNGCTLKLTDKAAVFYLLWSGAGEPCSGMDRGVLALTRLWLGSWEKLQGSHRVQDVHTLSRDGSGHVRERKRERKKGVILTEELTSSVSKPSESEHCLLRQAEDCLFHKERESRVTLFR